LPLRAPSSPTARSGRLLRVALAGLVLLLVLLLAAQLVLPRLAERRVRDELGTSADIAAVHVRAVPAVELLWGHADRVTARVRSYRASPRRIVDLLVKSRDADALDVRLDRLQTSGVVVRDVALEKRGGVLTGRAGIGAAELARLLPPGVEIAPGAGTVVLHVHGVPAGLQVQAQDGHVVVAPDVPLIGSLFSVTLFEDPRLDVQSVSLTRRADGGVSATARGRLRG
jgi:hypothetical protein